MSTLCLCDLGELRDEWLREPRPQVTPTSSPRPTDGSVAPVMLRQPLEITPVLESVAA